MSRLRSALDRLANPSRRVKALVFAAAVLVAVPGDVLVPVLTALLLLTVIVSFHEFSHLLVARLFGARVLAFGIGFGPRLLGVRRLGIEWGIHALPLGGFVSLAGESRDADDAAEPGSFARLHPVKQALVFAAGPVANFLLAWLALAGVGVATLAGKGMPPADALARSAEVATGFLGYMVSTTLSVVAQFAGHAENALDMPLAGLPSMVTASGQAVASGSLVNAGVIVAALSIGVAIMNLLPIPPLDGGQAVMRLVAGAVPAFTPRAEKRVVFAGLALLLVVMVAVNGIDIVRVVTGYTPPVPGQ